MVRHFYVLAAMLAVLVAGCGAGTASGPGTLTFALSEDPDELDPTISSTFVSRMVFAQMCEKLYDVDNRLHLVPQLASSLPRVSQDGRTVTIPLRRGVRFNDGTPFDAAAVKTSLDRHRTLKESSRAGELAPVAGVDVVDPLTVRLHLKARFSPLTSLLADRSGMIMSPRALKRLGAKFGTAPVCVGPFRFRDRVAGDRIVLDRSPDYYDAAGVKLDRVVFRIITEGSVRASNLRSGDVDAAERLDPVDVVSIEGDPSIRLQKTPEIGYRGLTINVGNKDGTGKPFHRLDTPLAAHPELREAFEDSLDRETINKVVFFDQFIAGCSSISPVSQWHDARLRCPGRDLEKARALVQRSGVKTPVPVKLMLENDQQQLRLAQVIQAMAGEAGFKVTLQPMEFTSALDRGDAGDFDVFMIGWSGRVDPDGNLFNQVSSTGPLNYGGLADPALDKLLEQGRQAKDPARRRAIYERADARNRADRSVMVLYHQRLYTGSSQDVNGLEVRPDGLPRFAHTSVGEG
jgi:peptide/nickel transport system substrate-binding protein